MGLHWLFKIWNDNCCRDRLHASYQPARSTSSLQCMIHHTYRGMRILSDISNQQAKSENSVFAVTTNPHERRVNTYCKHNVYVNKYDDQLYPIRHTGWQVRDKQNINHAHILQCHRQCSLNEWVHLYRSQYGLKTRMHKVVKDVCWLWLTQQHWLILNRMCKNKYPWMFTLNTFIYGIPVVEYCLRN